tara:strand:- start:2747 stop:3430 length:684 start_codon:yes stop_codon:yes gene_type:complete
MKKLFISFFFILISISSTFAHVGHYDNYKKFELEILRNGKTIGFSHYFFSKNNHETIVTNQIKFSVKLLGKIIFQVEGYGEEKYFQNQLVSYNSQTKQNNKNKFVNLVLNKDENVFYIKGSSYQGKASIDNVIGNWWNHKILQTQTQISPISGSIKDQVVTFIGKEKIEQYGKIYSVDRFKLQSKDMSLPKDKRLNFDIWFDPINSLIIKVSYSRMGNWEYRLKYYE